RAFVEVMKTTMLITAPLSVAIWHWSPYLVTYVIGDKWERILPLIQILVVAGLLRSFNALAGALFQACNRPDLDFKMNLSRLLVMAALLWPFATWWGLEGVSLVIVLAVLSTLPVWFFGVAHLLNLGPIEVLRSNLLTAISATVLATCLTLANRTIYTTMPGGGGAVLAMLGGLAIWIGLMAILHVLTPFKIFAEINNLRKALSK
ncbi:MAG: polysaccharide biosynthesis C-terminal domain-containing protein, partial [Bradymonadaceae bacterium]